MTAVNALVGIEPPPLRVMGLATDCNSRIRNQSFSSGRRDSRAIQDRSCLSTSPELTKDAKMKVIARILTDHQQWYTFDKRIWKSI